VLKRDAAYFNKPDYPEIKEKSQISEIQ